MSPATVKDVRATLLQYGLIPRKKWGQNFLVDRNILNKIAEASGLSSNTYAVEIGPGLGTLTMELAGRSKGVLAIEIDQSLKPALENLVKDLAQVRLLFKDVLSIDIEQELREAFQIKQIPGLTVCANIPYNITTPIIFKVLEECPSLVSATLMMQKEVADRIMAKPGGKDYGVLTLTVALHAQVKLVGKVSRNCFYPKPEVESSIIQLTPHHEDPVPGIDRHQLKRIIKAAFQKRRKMILNICTDYFEKEKSVVEEVLRSVEIDPASRPEKLRLQDFALLLEAFSR